MGWVPPSTGGGGGPLPSPTVAPETFGTAGTAGISALFSKGDHIHPMPENPTFPMLQMASNINPGQTNFSLYDASVPVSPPSNSEPFDGTKVDALVGAFSALQVAGDVSKFAAEYTKTVAAGKLFMSQWVENIDSQAKQFSQQFTQMGVKPNFTGTLRMGLLVNTGVGDVLPPSVITADNGAGVDPTLGAGLTYLAPPISIAVTAGIFGEFGYTSTPGAPVPNIASAIWSNAPLGVGDNIALSSVKEYSGAGFSSLDTGSQKDAMAGIQRRIEKSYSNNTPPGTAGAPGFATFQAGGAAPSYFVKFNVPKLKTPTMTMFSPVTGAAGVWRNTTTAADVIAVVTDVTPNGFTVFFPVGVAAGATIQGHWLADASF